ncbi:MAG TPA: MarR family transcriptional regulator [Mycobacteriales bacterium]|nr:MarR family transcriptional regulator [Mycobacteriales bacterium]
MPAIDHRVALTPVPGSRNLGLVDGLAQLTFAVQGALTRIAASHDVSVVQARLLGILRDREPTIKELAAFLGLDKSSVTGLVDRAEERGLVHRVPSTVDGRSVHVRITAPGRALIKRATAQFEAEIGELVAGLSASQRKQLSEAATVIAASDAGRRGVDIFAVRE